MMNTKNTFWSLRQNPFGNTNQEQMENAIKDIKFVSCPFAHISTCRNNYLDGIEDKKSKRQSARFDKDIQVGDFVLIPFKGRKTCILAKVITDTVFCVETGYCTIESPGNKYTITKDTAGVPFRPVGRMIEIINDSFTIEKRSIPINSLSKLKSLETIQQLDREVKKYIARKS